MCKNPKAKHAFEAQKKLSDTPERGGGEEMRPTI